MYNFKVTGSHGKIFVVCLCLTSNIYLKNGSVSNYNLKLDVVDWYRMYS